MMEPPVAPPPLAAMAARKAKLEADREVLFIAWKAALEAAKGNITEATSKFTVGGKKVSKYYGAYLTKTFGLVEYAAELRVEAGQPKAAGRPWPKRLSIKK